MSDVWSMRGGRSLRSVSVHRESLRDTTSRARDRLIPRSERALSRATRWCRRPDGLRTAESTRREVHFRVRGTRSQGSTSIVGLGPRWTKLRRIAPSTWSTLDPAYPWILGGRPAGEGRRSSDDGVDGRTRPSSNQVGQDAHGPRGGPRAQLREEPHRLAWCQPWSDGGVLCGPASWLSD